MPVIFDRVSFQPSGLSNNSRRHRPSGQGGGIIQTTGFLSAAWGAGAGASPAQTEIAASSPTTGIRARIYDLLFARPHVLRAARLKEICFSLSFIAAPSCQAWRRASTGERCLRSTRKPSWMRKNPHVIAGDLRFAIQYML